MWPSNHLTVWKIAKFTNCHLKVLKSMQYVIVVVIIVNIIIIIIIINFLSFKI